MQDQVQILLRTKQITDEEAKRANAALTFYDNSVTVLPFQKSATQPLSELLAIDYSKPVEIVQVKPGRVFTQMQQPGQDQSRYGSFFAEGSIAGDYNNRADSSGIGIVSAADKKSTYLHETTAQTTFLRSTAAPALDTWSTSYPQFAKGGGTQLRVATSDYSSVVKPQYAEVYFREDAADKTVQKGYNAVPTVLQKASHPAASVHTTAQMQQDLKALKQSAQPAFDAESTAPKKVKDPVKSLINSLVKTGYTNKPSETRSAKPLSKARKTNSRGA